MKVCIRMTLAGFICLSTLFVFAAEKQTPQVVTHVVTEDETAWFIASIYYGNGSEFTKILKFNHLQRAEDMKEGMTLQIDNPKFSKQTPHFAERYAKLWSQRQKALGLSVGNKLPSSMVVIPTERILHQDNTPTLPFTEIKDSRRADDGE